MVEQPWRPEPREKISPAQMQALFRTVAPKYDFITRVFSYGMDAGWKRLAVERTPLGRGALVLDLACGTGDFSRLVEKRGAVAVGCDLTHNMLRAAKQRGLKNPVCGDALRLPFPDATFDAAFVGYGVRNFPRIQEAIGEIHRVLKPGATFTTLDFFLPSNDTWRGLFLRYLKMQGAFWGTLLHGDPGVYTYIPRSLQCFLSTGGYRDLLTRGGFEKVRVERFLGGGIAIEWAERSALARPAVERR